MAKKVVSAGSKKRSPLKVLLKLSIWGFVAVLVAGPSILHSKAGISISPILTGSMRPYANPGDVFITKHTKASDLKVGDIISVNSQTTGVFYAHRIVEITSISGRLRVITKGDANTSPEIDPFMVSPQGEVAKEFMRIKWLGRPIIYLTSVQGRQAGLALMVFANVVGLFMFLFRNKVTDHNPFHIQVYKDLYAEAHAAHVMRTRELKVFKELFEASLEDKKLLEAELAEIEQQINDNQLAQSQSIKGI
jgi:signal peptidase I